MDDTYLILRGPVGIHVWPLGAADMPTVDSHIVAGRALLGYPVGDAWIQGGEWDASLVEGRPHDDLMRSAILHDPAELATVDTVKYRADHDAACHDERVAGVAAALAQLDDVSLGQVLDHPALGGRARRAPKAKP